MNPAQLLAHFDRLSEAPDALPRLRRFILDLAVRGKLVEQDPGDEPASELIKRIRAEKAKRNLKEKAKPGKASSTKDTGLNTYKLPKGWVWTPLADLTAIFNGRAYSKNELLHEGTPVLRVGNLFTSDYWYYSNLTLEDDKYCDKGDLLFAWSASFGPFIWPGPKVIYHYHIWKLSLHSESCLYKNYLFRFLIHKTQEIKDSGHGVSMIHMTKEKMEKLLVPLPPLAEQHRIVAKVDELMALCDRLEAAKTQREQSRERLVAASLQRLNDAGQNRHSGRDCRNPEHRDVSIPPESAIPGDWIPAIPAGMTDMDNIGFFLNHLPRLTTRPAHIKQLRQTILNLAVRGKLVEQYPGDEPASELLKRIREEKARLVKAGIIRKQDIQSELPTNKLPFALPPNWAMASLGNLIHLVSGQHLQPSEYSSQEKDGLPYVTGPSDFGPNCLEITRYALVKKAVAKKEQILLTVKGAGVGKTAICDLPEVAISRQLMALTAIGWEQRFLLLITHRLAETLKNNARSLIPGIGREDVEEFVLALPPLPEQHRIVAKVDELMALCDQLETQLTATATDSRNLLEAVLNEALNPAQKLAA